MQCNGLHAALGFCVASICAGGTAWAIPRVSAPALDFKGDVVAVQVPNSGGIPTTATYITIWGSAYQAPTWGAPASIYPLLQGLPLPKPFGAAINTFNDYIIISNPNLPDLNTNQARFVATGAYVEYDDALPPGGTATTAKITTIYGQDTAPNSPGVLALAGFDTSGPYPEFINESITGPSGTVYNASVGQLVTVSSLPTLLPGYDLSMFGTNTTGSVWMFQTTISSLELVPEPASLGAIACVATVILTRRRRAA